jgi:hypothetical protein
MGGECSTYGKKDANRILVVRPEGRRPLGRPRRSGRITLKRIFKKWDGGHGLD